MNANHARPLLAFWALAVAAAVITGIGLQAGARDVTVSAGAPAPVRTSGTPELVLGALLRVGSTGVFAHPPVPGLSSSPATGATAGTGVHVSSPASGTEARSHGTGGPATIPTGGSVVTKTSATASGKTRKHPVGHATATATASPTGGTHGKGSADDHPGKGR